MVSSTPGPTSVSSGGAVFLSYARENTGAARRIADAASASEWSVIRSLTLAATPTKPKQALVAFGAAGGG